MSITSEVRHVKDDALSQLATSETLNENVNKLGRSFAEFIGSHMSSAGLLTSVRSLMTTRVKACSTDDSLGRAAQLMWEGDCGIVPVTTEHGRVLGLLTDRDICMATYTQGRPPGDILAGSVMSTSVFACTADDSIGSALSMMAQHRIRRLPVTHDGAQLVGMLTLADIARWARATATSGVEAALSDALGDISKRTLESERTAAE